MSRKFLTHLDLAKNEIQNGVAQNLAAAPSSPVKGQFYFNSTDNIWYWWDGTTWQPAKSGAPAFGSVTAEQTFGAAPANGVSSNVARSDHGHGNPTHDTAAHSAIPLSGLAVPTGPVSMNGYNLTNLGTPTALGDATSKFYVDNLQAGLSWKDSVRVATTAAIVIATALNAGDVIDGVTLAAADRVLVKNQSAAAENGIYVVGASPARSSDADAWDELVGAAVFITEGTTHADQAWVMTTNPPITLGTTALTWAQFGAGTAYTAGAGLTLTGSTFDVVPLNASIVVAADTVGVGFASSGGDAGSSVQPARGDHVHSGYTRKYSVSVGGAVTATVTHNLGTRDVSVNVYRVASPYDQVECDVEMTDTNTVTLRFTVAPAASEYRCVVIG